jgi:hypothetical protein
MDILRALMESYLVATLSATGLAKLANYRTSSAGMARERIFPVRIALPTILTVATVELSIAVLLAAGLYSGITLFSVAVLFVSFAGYRVIVAAKTNAIVCSCAGTVRTDAATTAAVAGGVLACVCVAGFACALAFISGRIEYPLNLIPVFCLILPVVSMVRGLRKRSGLGDRNRFPDYQVALGTEEI